MSKKGVMLRNMEDVMLSVDEKIKDIRRSGVPINEMTDRQCREIDAALDMVFENSNFAQLPNGRRVFSRAWDIIESKEKGDISLYDDTDNLMLRTYCCFCREAEPYLDIARIAAGLD